LIINAPTSVLLSNQFKEDLSKIYDLKAMGVREADPPKEDVQLDVASSFTQKIQEVNRLYLKKK